MAMPGEKIELGWLVPNKMLCLISSWEIFEVQATAIHKIYLRNSVLLKQQKNTHKKNGEEGKEALISAINCTQKTNHYNPV